MAPGELISILGLGFLLGVRHAFDADHLAAVSTLLSKHPGVRTSGFIGLCWGLGHTAMLLLVGLVVIMLNVTIPEEVARAFEFAVGVMLVVLGVSLAWSLWQDHWHVHRHDHDGTHHLHLHRHAQSGSHDHDHWMQRSTRPLIVGMVHGLAGSAALMLMILSSVKTAAAAVGYILVFGVGSIIGMAFIAVLLSVPFARSAPFGRRAQMMVQGGACLVSIVLGFFIMLQMGLGGSLS